MTPSTDWQEQVADGEDAELERLAQRLAEVMARRGGRDRALHAKAHIGLCAQVTVDEGLPAHAAQGMFARPGSHPAYLRLSNGGGDRRVHDKKPDVRGLALKVLGVEGDKVLLPAASQDWLAIDTSRVLFRDPHEFVTAVVAASGKGVLGTLIRELGLGRTLSLAFSLGRALRGRPVDLLDVTFNTALPVAFGPYAARLEFVPLHAPSPKQGAGRDRDYLAARIAARAASEPLRYEIRGQFFTGPDTPIEDPTVDWPSPYVRLGEVATVPIDPASETGKRLADFIEGLSFDPWHALVAHRPLGAMMRARKHAYFASTKARAAAAEPDGSEWAGFQPSDS